LGAEEFPYFDTPIGASGCGAGYSQMPFVCDVDQTEYPAPLGQRDVRSVDDGTMTGGHGIHNRLFRQPGFARADALLIRAVHDVDRIAGLQGLGRFRDGLPGLLLGSGVRVDSFRADIIVRSQSFGHRDNSQA